MNRIKWLLKKVLPQPLPKGYRSFSQCGEDILVNYIFQLRGVSRPSYIDVGAHHPFHLNNTAIFYLNGSTGINIEANPNLLEVFKKARTKDLNLNIGIGNTAKTMDFYIFSDETLSTFDPFEKAEILSQGKVTLTKVIEVDLIDLNKVHEMYNYDKPVDFLTIDVEGLDEEILKSLDYSKYAPKVICVEAAEYSPIGAGERRNELIDFLISKNYYEYANTNLNAIMVRRDFWFINE